MLSRMCVVVSFVVPILENLAARCAVSALFYICEVAEDGSVLAGVKLEFLGEDAAAVPQRRFFWSSVWRTACVSHSQAVCRYVVFVLFYCCPVFSRLLTKYLPGPIFLDVIGFIRAISNVGLCTVPGRRNSAYKRQVELQDTR
jgi:hypothetical protein